MFYHGIHVFWLREEDVVYIPGMLTNVIKYTRESAIKPLTNKYIMHLCGKY